MTDLKDRAAKWLKSNGSLVVAGIGLILIAINDSFIGVFMYAVVIHILGFSYIAGLYDKDYLSLDQVKALAKQKRGRNKPALTAFITLCAVSIVILVARDHWYLLVITIATIIGISIHIIDGMRRIKEYRETTA